MTDTSNAALERTIQTIRHIYGEGPLDTSDASLRLPLSLLDLIEKARALAAERDAERHLSAQLKREVDANIARANNAIADRDAARAALGEASIRIAWLEQIREGAGRALCKADGIAPDEPIADGGHVAWELHVYQRAHAALAAKEGT